MTFKLQTFIELGRELKYFAPVFFVSKNMSFNKLRVFEEVGLLFIFKVFNCEQNLWEHI